MMNDDTTLLNLECIPLFGSYERITDFDYAVFSIVIALFIVVVYCCVACILQTSDHLMVGSIIDFSAWGNTDSIRLDISKITTISSEFP